MWSGFVLGVLAGKKTERLPMFTMSCLTVISFVLLCYFNDSSTLGMFMLVAMFFIPYLISFFITSIIIFLRIKNPRSPFLSVRLYQKIPIKIRLFIDCIGIIIATGFLLFVILKGEEVPKFAYYYLEYTSSRNLVLLGQQSSEIDNLIDRKRNIALSPDLDYSDALLMTDVYMRLFEEQKKTIDDMKRILDIQAKIPFLPETYKAYHETKKKWLEAHIGWFDAFYGIKKLEKQESDLLLKLDDAEKRLRSVNSPDKPEEASVRLYAAIALSKEIQKTLEEMRNEKHLTEDMEDFFALTTKQVIDIANFFLETTVASEESTLRFQEILDRGTGVKFMPIYEAWKAAIIEPIENKKDAYLKQEVQLFTEINKMANSDNIFENDLITIAKKLKLFPISDKIFLKMDSLPLTKSELAIYYQMYKNPFVIHIRKALDAYLAGDNISVKTSEDAIKSETKDGYVSGLDSFDKTYFKSKFIVFSINDSDVLGKIITIIFQDKPDRIFNACVYQDSNDEYILQFFGSKNIDIKEIEAMQKQYKQNLEDKEHAL